MLPELAPGFKWIQSAAGPALVCTELQQYADHFFTTRSWTLGSAADRDCVEGWHEVAGALGLTGPALLRARQVHGAAVVVHRRGQPRDQRQRAEADVLVTNDPSVALAIQTADCVPLLVVDRQTGSIAAAHAGWRGLAAGVPQVAVDALTGQFGSRVSDLVAVIGPSISAARYEVAADVYARFEQGNFRLEQLACWLTAGRPGHWHFDGWRCAHDQLGAAGLSAQQIHAAMLCTASHPETLCSYRRDGTGAGRIVAAIRARER
jgi:YfiH family protein